jgi:hypothetical protein
MSPLLIFHIALGGIALLAGGTALVARKGDRLHRRTGTVFFAAMILMALAAAVVAVVAPAAPYLNILVAVVTIYLVTTSWLTAKRVEGMGSAEVALLVLGLGAGVAGVAFGAIALGNPKGSLDRIPAGLYFGFGALAFFSAAIDWRVIRRGGVSGAARIARHLWRMSVALLIASLAFFVGQGSKVFPQWFRDSNLQVVPLILIAVLFVFWLARVRFTRWGQQNKAKGGEPPLAFWSTPT